MSGTDPIEVIRWNLSKIVEENQGDGDRQVGKDPQTISRAKECLEALDELEQKRE